MTAADQTFELRVGAASHRGLVRAENQDRISRFQGHHGQIFLVVDGMGGHGDGGRAAEVAVESLEGSLSLDERDRPDDEAMRRAVEVANETLLRLSASDGASGRKMGATLVMARLDGACARIAHAGDSRAYLFRAGALQPLTRDHTLVQQMVDANLLSEEAARDHPDASVVTRALGQEAHLALTIGETFSLRAGDRLLLCSDGLTGYVGDQAIQGAMAEAGDVQSTTEQLIGMALAAGGEDNVSIQLVEIARGIERRSPERRTDKVGRTTQPMSAAIRRPASAGSRESRSGGSWSRTLVAVALVVVLIATIWMAFNWKRDAGGRTPAAPVKEPATVEGGPATERNKTETPGFLDRPWWTQPRDDSSWATPASPTPRENDDESDLSSLPHREP